VAVVVVPGLSVKLATVTVLVTAGQG